MVKFALKGSFVSLLLQPETYKNIFIMMRNLYTSMKLLALTIAFSAATSAMADNVIGQPVTEFTNPDLMKLDYPYGLQGANRTLLRTKLLTFQIQAPADGIYGIEYLVNATGNNVQLAANASDSEEEFTEPSWSEFVHMICTTDADLPTPIDPDMEETVPIDGDETPDAPNTPIELAQPVRLYSAVNLHAGINYVHVWMHVYWRNDNVAPQKVQFKSIKVLGQGSGEVAGLAARASQKAFRVKYFTSLQDATTASMLNDYQNLLEAIADNYSTASTAIVEADIAAVEAKEQDVRHGKGVIINKDSTRIDLLLYHNEFNNPSTMASLGGYDENGAYEMENGLEDYPTQLEFTRNNYFTYKFTAGKSGNWFVQYYASSNNAATINMTILAEDSTTVIMPLYKLSTANGSWTNYQFMSNPDMTKFAMEEGKTYILHMYYNQYTNVRDILLRYIPKQTYDTSQLGDLCQEAEGVLGKYTEGTLAYYTVEDRSLLDKLADALDNAYEALDGDLTTTTEAYENLKDAMNALSGLKTINVIPTDETNPFDVTTYSESYNCSYKIDGGIMQLDNFRSGGHMIYKLYNTTDAEYQVDFEFAHQNSGAQMQFMVYVNENDFNFSVADATSEVFESTGGWQTFEPKTMRIGAIPTGYVYMMITGTGPSYVGNPRMFKFTPIPGTEGAGSIALEKAKEEFYAKYTPENMQELIQRAQESIAIYAPGTIYDYVLIDRAPIENVETAINNAYDALAYTDSETIAKAYISLEKAINGLSNVKAYNWIPNDDMNRFNLSVGDFIKWRYEDSGNIDYGYVDGSVTYRIYVTEDAKYNMTVTMANPADGGSFRLTAMPEESETVLFDNVYTVPNTGSWNKDESIFIENIPMPQGFASVKIAGETAAGDWVGNIYGIIFSKIDGTEGEGSNALANSINDVSNNSCNNKIYNINGQYVGNHLRSLPKGIYIINGKKMVIR